MHKSRWSVLLCLAALAALLRQPVTEAQQVNRVGLVVDFGDHHITRCVAFSESELTGYDVLRRAGLDLVVDASNPMGVTVCDINQTSGCPASNCFCKCQGSPCVYWSYHHLENGSWQYSGLGASSRKVHHGDVEGWGWGTGNLNSGGQQPPVIPFEQICAPTPTETPVPTDTPIPPSSTPVPPTDTPAPTSEPAPEVWFRLDDNPILSGSCTTLRWDASHVQEVYLDGDPVGIVGSRQVCPTTPTDYELRVVGMEEEATYQLTLGVTGSTATATASALPRATRAPSTPTVNQPAATEPTASPTIRGGAGATTPSTETVHSSSAPEASTATSTPLPSSTPPPRTIRPGPSSTPDQAVEAEGSTRQVDALDEPAPVSPLVPVSYIAFSLIVGGLVGWLVYILRFRR